MTTMAHHIDTCLAHSGTESFAKVFCEFVETLGIDQIMIFSIGDSQASCLMSRHFSNAALADELATMYLDGWYQHDPLLPELRALAPGNVTLRRLDDVVGEMETEYRERFFDGPGLSTKTTLLGSGRDLRLFVSLYQTGSALGPPDSDLARLVGRLAMLHFEALAQSQIPALLDVLSSRERAVCVGILGGQKAEVIAAEIGVAASTVITYRKRAYAKLGISSRASLFALCRV